MNLYMLVEGAQTEVQLYPRWLSYMLPELTQVQDFRQATHHHYYLFSGGGIPSIYDHAANAVADINRVGTYHYFIICLDSEALSRERREELLRERIQPALTELKAPCRFEVVVQHRCIETWLLGNRKVYQRNPSGNRFREYTAFYNVETHDPERMGCPPNAGFQLTARFHEAYLRAMLAEKHIRYRKSRPGEVAKRYYFDELTRRITDEPTHLQSFGELMALFERIRREM